MELPPELLKEQLALEPLAVDTVPVEPAELLQVVAAYVAAGSSWG
jgi:hypothetical protein